MRLMSQKIDALEGTGLHKDDLLSNDINEIEDLRKLLLAEKDTISRQDLVLSGKETELQDLRKAVEKWSKEAHDWKQKALSQGETLPQMDSLHAELDSMRNRIQDLETRLQTADENEKNIRVECEEWRRRALAAEEHASILEKLSDQSSLLKEKDNQLFVLHKRCADLQATQDEFEDEVRKLREENEAREREIVDFKREIEAKDKQLERFLDELSKRPASAPANAAQNPTPTSSIGTSGRRRSVLGMAFTDENDEPPLEPHVGGGASGSPAGAGVHVDKAGYRAAARAVRAQSVVLATVGNAPSSPTTPSSSSGTGMPSHSQSMANMRSKKSLVVEKLTINAIRYEACCKGVLEEHATLGAVILTAVGKFDGECYVEWKRSLNSSPFQVVHSGPAYQPTADDIGATIQLCVTPIAPDGTTGVMLTAQTQPLALDKDLYMRMTGYLRQGEVQFAVLLTGAGLVEIPAKIVATKKKIKVRVTETTLFKFDHTDGTKVELSQEDPTQFRMDFPPTSKRKRGAFEIRTFSNMERDFVVLTLRMFVTNATQSDTSARLLALTGSPSAAKLASAVTSSSASNTHLISTNNPSKRRLL
eukprot:TRINITY_DN1108_c0_g2::TRINITY_DN1108_c0_g2_i1::g.17357::m.17357 TRINITY_DN1108_c0_g2::TRINITY_DN1108_c0_g2_i1::g.17357  ORF type:complete len:591 (-),score=127.96,sp/F4IIU4/AIR9_ARATH/27.32/4e-07,TMF_DNA_bd/PF12329.3/61,TMF_DNA_bd/PF12329.3/1.1e+02,TMF_DNA_bd/PF12329.3/5.6e-06,TMF_TATA_bd/PF12325.3/0.23,TMF_TATA_bd/PF12325.3/0.053,ATG16/PF08614.6/39,ATG16/PF08614.6/93,ATG16/PF08614.6/0.002,ATG16/PF08614.6/1.5e+03,Tropomyosin_1/PF12718.2/4.1,Tropomyosin_1/PF12718.2/0.013,Syntaxin-6_N/PF09177.6/0.